MDKVLIPEVIVGVSAGASDSIKKARDSGTNIAIWRDGKATEIQLDNIEYNGFIITVLRLDSARWTVNLSSNIASLMSKLDQPNMVFSDPNRDVAIDKAKKYVDGVLN